MAKTTPIEWCDSVLNLQMGCDGCELWNPKAGVKICYAGKITERYGGKSSGYPESFDKPRLFLERLSEAERWSNLTGTDRPNKPWLNGLPRLIFLDDMGDTFTESLPIDWLAPLLPRMAILPHIFILLTKRANRMLEFSKTHPFPENFWLLVSVTSAANYNRIEQLMEVCGGSVKGISYEPAWGPIDIRKFLGPQALYLGLHADGTRGNNSIAWGLGWAIAGGESGTFAGRCDLEWMQSVVEQCKYFGTPIFCKQIGSNPYWAGYPLGRAAAGDSKGGNMADWPEWARIRQFPACTTAHGAVRSAPEVGSEHEVRSR